MGNTKQPKNPERVGQNNDETEMQTLKISIENCKEIEDLNKLSQKIEESKLQEDQKEELKKLITAKQQEIENTTKVGETEAHELANQIKATADSAPQTPAPGTQTEQQPTSPSSSNSSEQQSTEEKGFLARHFDALTSKNEWSKNPLKNVGRGILTVLSGYGLYKGIKWVGNKIKGLFLSKEKRIEKLQKELDELNQKFDNDTITEREYKRRRKLIEEIDTLERRKRTDEIENRPRNAERGSGKEEPGFLQTARNTIKSIGGKILGFSAVAGIGGTILYHTSDKAKGFMNKARDYITGRFSSEKPMETPDYITTLETKIKNNQITDPNLSKGFDSLTYDENTGIIKSYGLETKIDLKKKKLVGLDAITFNNEQEVIFTATLVNYLKYTYGNQGGNKTPFSTNNAEIQFLNHNNEKEDVLTFDAQRWAPRKDETLKDYAKSISEGNNLQYFINYLNKEGEPLRPKRENETLPEDTSSPIGKERREVIEDIWLTGGEGSGRRKPDLQQDPNKPENFTLYSYGEQITLTLTGNQKKGQEEDNHIDYSTITNIKIGKYNENDGGELEIQFPHDKDGLKEALRVANLTNMIRREYKHEGAVEFPFRYDDDTIGGGIRFNVPWSLWSNRRDRRILEKDTLEEKYPTLLKDLQKQKKKRNHNDLFQQSKHNKNKEGYGSNYIKFLHQMTDNGNSAFWKKIS